MANIAIIAIFVENSGLLQLPERHGLSRFSMNYELILASLCRYFDKGDAILEHKRTFGMSAPCPEHLIDRLDQTFSGTKILPQRVGRAGGVPARSQICVNIRPAKSIDRLFGIADH